MFLKSHIVVACIMLCFLISVSFVVNEIIDHDMFSSQRDNVGLSKDINAFSNALYVMSLSGFILLVVVIGGMINLSRLNRNFSSVNEYLKCQMRAFESSRDGIAILDENGMYTYLNRAHASCYGYEDTAELLGTSWKKLYDPEQMPFFEKVVFPLLKENASWIGQSEGVMKDGSVFPQEISLNLLEGGGMICVVRDITEKIKNEKLLKIIKLAVEAASDGVLVTDSNNKILFLNHSYLTLHGYDSHDRDLYMGADWRDFYNKIGQDQINSYILPATILKGYWSDTLKVVKKDGKTFYGDASLTRLADGMIIGVIRDVTGRKLVEREREDLRDQLFQSQKMEAIGRLTGGIAKDFSEILSGIYAHAEHLKQDVGNPAQAWQAQEILSAITQANELVGQLVSFSHKKEMKVGMIDISQNVIELRAKIMADIPDNIDYASDIKISDAYTYANPGQIDQILMNLCRNAREAVKDKRGKIAVSLREPDWSLMGLHNHIICDDVPDKTKASSIRLKAVQGKKFLMSGFLLKGRRYLQVTVSDTGRGIAPEILPHIFDPFFTTKGLHKGAGLGLSAVHGMMVSGNGAIVVESVFGEGTSVHLFFPRTDVLEYRPRLGSVSQADAGLRKILVLVEGKQTGDILAEAIKRLGFSTQICGSVKEVIDQLEGWGSEYSLVLADDALVGDMKGKFVKMLNNRFSAMPVILMSEYSSGVQSNSVGSLSNIRGVLRKPVNSETLSQKIFLILNPSEKAAV